MKRIFKYLPLISAVLLSAACVNVNNKASGDDASGSGDSPVEARMRAAGLVDIHDKDSTIAVHLVYATPYNFMGKVLYNDMTKAFMIEDMAENFVRANRLLKSIRPDVNLLIYDACRPISVQWDMWKLVKGTDKQDFVANPESARGLHNYGAAVDVTLMDCTGRPLPMGSEYDFFGKDARTDCEAELLSSGRITSRELENRLRVVAFQLRDGRRSRREVQNNRLICL